MNSINVVVFVCVMLFGMCRFKGNFVNEYLIKNL